MEAELESWQALQEGTSDPVDFLIVEPSFRDVLRGLLSYVAAVVRYRLLDGIKSPWNLRQEIGFADADRRLGPARVAEVDDWLDEELDFFETSDRHNA